MSTAETNSPSSANETNARASAAYFGVCAATIGFALCYALPIYARLPRPFYDPIARQWFIAATAPPIPMGYVGQILWAVVASMISGAVTFAIVARKKSAPGAQAETLAGAWALTALVIIGAYFTWNNWP